MITHPDLTHIARTIGDATRARMLTLLMDGRATTAKELAYRSGVDPATATSHLQRLQSGGLVSVVLQGRHKFFCLSTPEVGQLMETMMVVARQQIQPTSAPAKAEEPIRSARFCYDHLAGKLGIRITQSLLARNLLLEQADRYEITVAGEEWFYGFGIDLTLLRRHRRKLAYPCLDWSERAFHLAGSLGAALAQRMLELQWIVREERARVVRLTEVGEEQMAKELGIETG